MSSIQLSCPHCQQALQTDASLAGGEVRCPTCGMVLQVPRSAVMGEAWPPAGAQPPAPPPVNMPPHAGLPPAPPMLGVPGTAPPAPPVMAPPPVAPPPAANYPAPLTPPFVPPPAPAPLPPVGAMSLEPPAPADTSTAAANIPADATAQGDRPKLHLPPAALPGGQATPADQATPEEKAAATMSTEAELLEALRKARHRRQGRRSLVLFLGGSLILLLTMLALRQLSG